jgi:hypothetical protein
MATIRNPSAVVMESIGSGGAPLEAVNRARVDAAAAQPLRLK